MIANSVKNLVPLPYFSINPVLKDSAWILKFSICSLDNIFKVGISLSENTASKILCISVPISANWVQRISSYSLINWSISASDFPAFLADIRRFSSHFFLSNLGLIGLLQSPGNPWVSINLVTPIECGIL